jgi:cyclopropane-fatty-acyl-phospholipid synthase
MNTDNSLPAVLEPTVGSTTQKPARGRIDRFYQSVIVEALGKMRRGHLRATLPDGQVVQLGNPELPVDVEIRITGQEFFKKCVLFGDVGFGEAYVAGDWETDDIPAVIRWLILNIDEAPSMSGSSARAGVINLFNLANRLVHLMRPNSVQTSRRNIHEHYDLGNNFYRLFLDPTMTYSCGLFTAEEQSLEAAQVAKYERLCRQLKLSATDHVLEIGCGWGGFSCHAAKKYGCRITAVTISQEQFDYARARVAREGLDDRVEIVLQDYRHITGTFDKIVSIEMLEAVGEAYLDTYFAKCAEVLKPDGLMAVQMITVPDSRYQSLRKGVDWIQKHIFPGSLLLSVGRVNQAINRTGNLFLHDMQDMGTSYERTLQIWRGRFNTELDEVRKQGFSESFIRKWDYYLSYCEGAFAMRNISVVQAVYTRPNNRTLTSKRHQ